MPDPSTPITWGLIGGLGTACTGLILVVARGWPIVKRFEEFLTDWAGEPARPGVDARPGVLPRLKALEIAVAEQGAALAEQGMTMAQLAALQTQKAAADQQMADQLEELRRKVAGA